MQVNERKKYPATYLLLGLTTLTFICQYLLNGFQATSPLSLFKIAARAPPTKPPRWPVIPTLGVKRLKIKLMTIKAK